MKYYNLAKDEEKLLKAYESGKFTRVKSLKQQKVKYKGYAETMLNKTKNINIRLSEKDIFTIKAKAVEKGIPYQTLLASVIHQYSSGKLPDVI